MPPIWYLDWPDITRENPDPQHFRVKGWIASVHPIAGLAFEKPPLADTLTFDIQPGTDVEKIFGMPAIRFQAECPWSVVRGLATATLFFESGGTRHAIIVPIHEGPVDAAAQKARKMARLLPLVACPACRAGLEVRDDACACPACGQVFPRDSRRFNFLPESLAREAAIAPTANVSANLYNGECLNYIHAHRDGLILDCGAGCKGKTYENVVNLEIVDYESTDVLAVAEHLPFRDGVFDVVFSFAVLEHVRNPAAAAREMVRVLKPDGILFCQAPLLAPVHAYPHHYYNMTLAGLGALFEGLVAVERLEPLVFGQPVHALTWFLTSYLKGLPPSAAKAFGKMRVRDLLSPADRYLGAPFVACLRPEVREELACCNYLIARKRAVPDAGAGQ
jgi:SAM-dependent methyltransferase